jgi:hypothetical protein
LPKRDYRGRNRLMADREERFFIPDILTPGEGLVAYVIR